MMPMQVPPATSLLGAPVTQVWSSSFRDWCRKGDSKPDVFPPLAQRGASTVSPFGRPDPGTDDGIRLGTADASIGKEGTEELAVIFRPLKLTAAARAYDDERYPYSWRDEPGAFKGSDSMG